VLHSGRFERTPGKFGEWRLRNAAHEADTAPVDAQGATARRQPIVHAPPRFERRPEARDEQAADDL
jgi:hypothetical protein